MCYICLELDIIRCKKIKNIDMKTNNSIIKERAEELLKQEIAKVLKRQMNGEFTQLAAKQYYREKTCQNFWNSCLGNKFQSAINALANFWNYIQGNSQRVFLFHCIVATVAIYAAVLFLFNGVFAVVPDVQQGGTLLSKVTARMIEGGVLLSIPMGFWILYWLSCGSECYEKRYVAIAKMLFGVSIAVCLVWTWLMMTACEGKEALASLSIERYALMFVAYAIIQFFSSCCGLVLALVLKSMRVFPKFS